MNKIGSNQSLVKITNQELIINEIRKNNTLSRSDLAKKLQLSNPSISKNVDDLIDKNIIIERFHAKTHVGRRPIILKFNQNCKCVAAVDLSGRNIRICLSDLSGDIFDEQSLECLKKIDIDTINQVIEILKEMLSDKPSDTGDLSAICIGSPGNIDPVTGEIYYARRVDALDLKGIFEGEFEVPVLVKNDVNLAVCGEYAFGCGQDSENLAYISIDLGVGAGFILNGHLYEGNNGFAGEIGSTVMGFDEETHEEIILNDTGSIGYIIKNIEKRVQNGDSPILSQILKADDKVEISTILKAVAKGDTVCVEEILRCARDTAVVLYNLNELFDFQTIIIGGSIMSFGDIYLKEISNYFNNLYAKRTSNRVFSEIKWSTLNSYATLKGAAHEAIELTISQMIDN